MLIPLQCAVAVFLSLGLILYTAVTYSDMTAPAKRRSRIVWRMITFTIIGLSIGTTAYTAALLTVHLTREPELYLVALPTAALIILFVTKICDATRTWKEVGIISWLTFALGLLIADIIQSVAIIAA